MDSGGWTSLEVAKLAVAGLTPLLVVGLAFLVARLGRRLEDAQWANRKLVERRIELYDEMAPLLNDLLCFFMVVGHFREIRPPDALSRKRKLDQTFYVNRYLMSPEFGDRYFAFVNACFKHYTGVGKQAQLRTSMTRQRAERGPDAWDEAWVPEFVGDRNEETPPPAVLGLHEALMQTFSAEVGVRSAGDGHPR